jgi:hypothetical protein
MSLIKAIKAQLGLSGDPAKNFTLEVPAAPDGTMKLARNSGQDIMTVAADGKVAFPATPKVYLPGEVIQQRNALDAGSSTTSNLWINTTTTPRSITPKSTSSTIIVEVTIQAVVPALVSINTEGWFYIKEGADFVGSQRDFGAPSGLGNTGAKGTVTLRAILSNASLAARSFLLWAATPQGPNISISALNQYWKITEVQN